MIYPTLSRGLKFVHCHKSVKLFPCQSDFDEKVSDCTWARLFPPGLDFHGAATFEIIKESYLEEKKSSPRRDVL